MARYILVHGNFQQTPAQQLPPELAEATQQEIQDAGWYLVIEPAPEDLPDYNPALEVVVEAKYTFDHINKTATPTHRVDPKYIIMQDAADLCPVCFTLYAEAEDREDNVAIQALIKGPLVIADPI